MSEKRRWYRELFSDSSDHLSSGRIMCMMAMVVGSVVLLAKAFGLGCASPGYETTLTFLFGGALGGKAAQKAFEK